MVERLNLTAAEVPPSILDWRVAALRLDWDGARIEIDLVGSTGERRSYAYSGPQASTMMVILNKANLSTNSLHKRILTQLIADHPELAGAISGTPD